MKITIDLEPASFARLIFEAKAKMQREDGCHGPNESCDNCAHHKECGNKVDSLVPWEELPPDHRSNLMELCQNLLLEMKRQEIQES